MEDISHVGAFHCISETSQKPVKRPFEQLLKAFKMAEADDYESLPDSTPFPIVATAGALAGVAEHCAMYPVDSVKVNENIMVKSYFTSKCKTKFMRPNFAEL